MGQIPAGSKISEPELARTYGISRGPLREAIHRLEGQRLVERTAHVGARVVSLSLQKLKEIYQIRPSLESLSCKLAAQHIDKKQILALRDVLRLHADKKTASASTISSRLRPERRAGQSAPGR
ncbi:GntR family transcriptional regulator [Klebsiella pneumoniae]